MDGEGDGDVDLEDYGLLAGYWLRIDCGEDNDWCGWSDFDRNSEVNLVDLANLAGNWLREN